MEKKSSIDHNLALAGESMERTVNVEHGVLDSAVDPGNSTSTFPEGSRKEKIKRKKSIFNIKASSSAIMAAIQLGLQHTLGMLLKIPSRDILMEDFFQVNICYFPSVGGTSNHTPRHSFTDFTFKDYSPVAFRYFRDIFGIKPEDFLNSLCGHELRELSSSGASGSLFFLSSDDVYVVKTVDQREAKFLQQLLPGYYMNLHQNSNTLLPKFFGLYCYSSLGQNVRLVMMNNLLPSELTIHEKYDIKGSTYKRRAGPKELKKKSPTLKDLDFLEHHPNGLTLEPPYYKLVMTSIEKDSRVLRSFKIMDYSLLLGIHYINSDSRWFTSMNIPHNCGGDGLMAGGSQPLDPGTVANHDQQHLPKEGGDGVDPKTNHPYKEMRGLTIRNSEEDGELPFQYHGGIPAKTSDGHHILLFIGIIDILQNYRLSKKIEHGWKSIVHDGKTISVNNPSFYESRFLEFCGKKVFKPTPGYDVEDTISSSVTQYQRSVYLTTPFRNTGRSQPTLFSLQRQEHELPKGKRNASAFHIEPLLNSSTPHTIPEEEQHPSSSVIPAEHFTPVSSTQTLAP